MKNRKTWLSVVAGILALVAVLGFAVALMPASVSTDPDECLHERARLVKEDGDKKIYYCPDCDDRFERVVGTDVFPISLFATLDSGEVVYNGNFSVGDFSDGVFTTYKALCWNTSEGVSRAHLVYDDLHVSSGYIVDGPEAGGFEFGDYTHEPAIAWTAPVDCTVSLSFGPSPYSLDYGPSFYLSVLHKDSLVNPFGEKITLNSGKGIECGELNAAFADVQIKVKAGDRIFFKFSHIEGVQISGICPTVTYVVG